MGWLDVFDVYSGAEASYNWSESAPASRLWGVGAGNAPPADFEREPEPKTVNRSRECARRLRQKRRP